MLRGGPAGLGDSSGSILDGSGSGFAAGSRTLLRRWVQPGLAGSSGRDVGIARHWRLIADRPSWTAGRRGRRVAGVAGARLRLLVLDLVDLHFAVDQLVDVHHDRARLDVHQHERRRHLAAGSDEDRRKRSGLAFDELDSDRSALNRRSVAFRSYLCSGL